MFKKILFFAAWCVAFLLGTVAFYSCSNEDLDEDSVQSKAELFRAKAKELSKKYGVDVTLNEENIEEIAATMTMEQFEKEFQMFATMQFDTISLVCKTDAPKKLRFKTKKRLTEAPDDLGIGHEYKGQINISSTVVTIHYTVWDDEKREYVPAQSTYTISGKAFWTFNQKGSSAVNIELSFSGTPTATGAGTITILSGNIINNQVAFTARGRIPVSSRLFHKSVMCSVLCDERSPLESDNKVVISEY